MVNIHQLQQMTRPERAFGWGPAPDNTRRSIKKNVSSKEGEDFQKRNKSMHSLLPVSGFAVYLVESELQLCTTGCGGG